MSETVAGHLSAAKKDIATGDKSLRSAADHIAAAIELGASQRDVAATVGKSAAWVNRLLAWKSSGFVASGPFTDDNKAKKQRAAFSPTKRSPKQKEEKSEARAKADQAKAEAAKAKAEQATAKHAAAEAKANARAEEAKRDREARDRWFKSSSSSHKAASIDSSTRDKMVKALGLLGSKHDGEALNAARAAELLRRKLNVSWDQLIVEASKVTERKAA